MEVKSVQPAFTGGRLTPKDAQKLIQKNWTIPMGVDSVKLSSKKSKPGFFNNIANFFKHLIKIELVD